MISIRRFLLGLLLSIMTIAVFFAAMQSYRSVAARAEQQMDKQLKTLAQSLLRLPPISEHRTTGSVAQGIAFQVWQDGNLVLHTDNTPDVPFTEQTGYSQANFALQRWRVFATHNGQRKVFVAQPMNYRYELAEELMLEALIPLVVMLFVLAIAIFLAVGYGLRPLKQLSRALAQQEPGDLTPLPAAHQPAELKPVIETLNSLMARLQQALERERRFASDAAHELRTPLTVLKVELYNLKQQVEDVSTLTSMEQGIDRMSHLIEQILLLNRTNPEHFTAELKDLVARPLLEASIARCQRLYQHKQQHLQLLADDFSVTGDEFSLKLLLDNLIGNAFKYTPAQGTIHIQAKQQGEHVLISIEDSGPGIPEAQYKQVFERFYRVGGDRHPSGEPGCGLGLAIVGHILELYQGQLRFSRSLSLGGLRVDVYLPARRD
ncbi:Histidine kinase [Saliniradius amylolyticus]|uniref:histidine kinase n=1 Tax=Saliniradius amylolyticus TaxID=2183582 RepID=A0A2S2E719_9ALTE|nr:ATP-binding protein [Saliniradius amylolyticus]AWL13332.1 Histidine kinase [Saliniradius amylolyticus]